MDSFLSKSGLSDMRFRKLSSAGSQRRPHNQRVSSATSPLLTTGRLTRSGGGSGGSCVEAQVLIIGKFSDPEIEFISDCFTRWGQSPSREFTDYVAVSFVRLHSSQFEYVYKDIQRQRALGALLSAKSSPIILLNATRCFESFSHLIAYFIIDLRLPFEFFIRQTPFKFNQQNDLLVSLTQRAHARIVREIHSSEQFTYVFLDIRTKYIPSAPSPSQQQRKPSNKQPQLQSHTKSSLGEFRIIIQLNTKIMPKTCFNFYQLCQSNFRDEKGKQLSYKHSSFHTFLKNKFIQAGGNSGGGGGGGGVPADKSVYGKYFEDENYSIKHDAPGIVGMANTGVPHTNASQFYITLAPMHEMDGKFVAFGSVIQGMKNIRKINKLATSSHHLPFEIQILNAGEYYFQRSDYISESKKEFDLLDNVEQMKSLIGQRVHSNYSKPSSHHVNFETLTDSSLSTEAASISSTSYTTAFNQISLDKSPGVGGGGGVSYSSNFHSDKNGQLQSAVDARLKDIKDINLTQWIAGEFGSSDRQYRSNLNGVKHRKHQLTELSEGNHSNTSIIDWRLQEGGRGGGELFPQSQLEKNRAAKSDINANSHQGGITKKGTIRSTALQQQLLDTSQQYRLPSINSPSATDMIRVSTREFRYAMKMGAAAAVNESSIKSLTEAEGARRLMISAFQEVSRAMSVTSIINQKQPSPFTPINDCSMQVSQISQFRQFLAQQYERQQDEVRLEELAKIIPKLSESIMMQMPASLKRSIMNAGSQQIQIDNTLLQETNILQRLTTENFFQFISKQLGFEESEVDSDW